MHEQRLYHTCGHELWRIDEPGYAVSFTYQVDGEGVRITHCPHCHAELSTDTLHKDSQHAVPVEPTPPTRAALHRQAEQLVDAAEQMEGRADTMRDRAETLRQQGDQVD